MNSNFAKLKYEVIGAINDPDRSDCISFVYIKRKADIPFFTPSFKIEHVDLSIKGYNLQEKINSICNETQSIYKLSIQYFAGGSDGIGVSSGV